MTNMEKSVKITLIIAGTIVLLALLLGFAISSLANINANTVSVQGQSVIKVTPDLVTIYFNVQTNGTTAKEAKDANSVIIDKMTSELIKLGFESKDIQTENLNIYEDLRWDDKGDTQKSYGFIASHQIKIELSTNSASKISDVIDAGVDSGALLSYINFELTTAKQNEYKTQALTEASRDAKTKAEAIASGLGKRVGKLVSVSTSNFDYRPWNVYSAGASSSNLKEDVVQAKVAANNIQPGSQEINGYISAVYKII